MAESHQLPFQHQHPQQQQQQGMASWYQAPPQHYQAQQPPPQQQHHNVQWPPPPPGDQSFSYSQPLPYQQGDFYSQAHQYPVPPQPQFTYMYGQQDQVWQGNNNWGYQQWAYPGENAGLTQEEVWAAKARAWAASKVTQNETQPPQPGSIAHQAYQDYLQQQDPQMLQPLEGQQFSLQPPGQEAAGAVIHDNVMNQGQNLPSKHTEQPVHRMGLEQSMQDTAPTLTSEPGSDNSEQKAMPGGAQAQSSDFQVVPSSYSHDISSSYGLDNSIAAPPGTEKQESVPQQAPLQQSAALRFSQQQPHLLPQSQAPPHVSQSHFSYTEQPSTTAYEHQQQQLEFHQQFPQNYQQQQQQQPQYHSTVPPVSVEGLEAEFGLSSGSMQNWAPIAGPGMPFPPAMGAGTPQFDHLHPPHQIPGPMFGRPHGPQQGLGFPTGGPFVAGGSPALGPGPGAPVRPMFIPDGFAERPKKAAVPSWLREELMKKKAAGLAGTSTGMLLSDESNRVNGGEPAIHLNQRHGISDRLRSSSPGLSDDEENDREAEIEATRNAAINQEIKRVLTEVLLKVTGDLFEEIAQETLEEDDGENFQGKVIANEQDRTANLNPASPPAPAPSIPARVLVSSLKSRGTSDDDDNGSTGSGVETGDVLGLGNYASDDDDIETKDRQLSVKDTEERTDTKYQDAVHQDNVDGRVNLDQNWLERNVEGRERGEELGGSKDKCINLETDKDRDKYRDKDRNTQSQSGKREEDKEVEREKRRHQEVGKKRSREKSARSPEPAHGHFKEYHADVQNGSAHTSVNLEGTKSHGNLISSKEEQRWAVTDDSKENHIHYSDALPVQLERNLSRDKSSRDKSSLSFKDDKEHRNIGDKHETKLELKERSAAGKETVAVVNNPLMGSVETGNIKETGNAKERETWEVVNTPKPSDASGKEKKREERTKDSTRKKGTEMVRNDKGSDERERDSNRDKRKEKSKEKAKSREKEQEWERRKNDKVKKEREGRTKRTDAMETRKSRRRSSSASSRGSGSRSDSSSSPDSRGRSHMKRSNRHRSSMPSPGRSKKRRVSRSLSRTRSRSPHAKHSHRRNAPSPSHDKSSHRRSTSGSPVHRRRHS